MKTTIPWFLIAIFICTCKNKSGSKTFLHSNLTYDSELRINQNDSLILTTSRHNNGYPRFADSTTSVCFLANDTLKIYLGVGQYEGSYNVWFYILKDTLISEFNYFDHYSNYKYKLVSGDLTLDKKSFKPGENIVLKVNYQTIGEDIINSTHSYDTVKLFGTIRLKVRDENFTFQDFSIENNRNEFFSLLTNRPDTIKKLNLYGCSFTDLPPEISLFSNLQALNLTGNNLSTASFKYLPYLKKLKSLNLTECNLSKLPSAILTLSNLEILNIWNNNIRTISDTLYNLTSLKQLTIGNNPLKILSPKIANLIKLESFESSSSYIIKYPKEMTTLKKLVEIYPNDTMYYLPAPLIKYAWGYDTIYTK